MASEITLDRIVAVQAAYIRCIDTNALESWPDFFTDDCLYTVTTAENRRNGFDAGIIYADNKNMLTDRVLALRKANIYEQQSYRHILGLPTIVAGVSDGPTALRGAFAIDTASRAMARLSTRDASATGKLDMAARHKAPARLRALSIGGVLAENVPASLADDLPEGVTGALGVALWARHRLRLAADARTLAVAP